MASMPLQVISDLYYLAMRNPGRTIGRGRGYAMEVSPKGKITLWHYGTVIYEKTPAGKVTIGGWSMSDANAINSLVYHEGGKEVYMTDGSIYFKGEGPRYARKKATAKRGY